MIDASNVIHAVGMGISSDSLADVKCFEVNNNTLYIGGDFSQSNGAQGNAIASWDGTSYNNLSNGITSTGGIVYSLQSWNGSLYVGGSFSEVDSIPANNIAKFDLPNGIKEMNDFMVSNVFPNPASTEININIHLLNNTPTLLQFIDLTGRVLYTNKINNGLNRIDINNLSKGMYIYKIISGNSVAQGKFIVN